MRIALILTVLLVVAVCCIEGSWRGRRAWRRHIKRAVITAAIGTAIGKRSASELDENLDDVVDQEEIESLLSTREAEAFLQLADRNADGEVSLDEFEKAVESQ